MIGFNRVCLIGFDRVVASFALGLRRIGFRGPIVGVAEPAVIDVCWKKGIVSDGHEDVVKAAAGADLIVVSRNRGRTSGALAQIVQAVDPNAVVSEMTRVKGEIGDAFAASGRNDVHYVGFRLVKEEPGVSDFRGANRFFFEGKAVILTPRGKEDLEAFAALQSALRMMGARVIAMSPQAHDRLMARVEHIPHLAVLAVLQRVLDEVDHTQLTPDLIGDWLMSEIRKLPELQTAGWAIDVEANRDLVLAGLDPLLESLRAVREQLEQGRFVQRFDALVTKTGEVASGLDELSVFDMVLEAGSDPHVPLRVSHIMAEAHIPIVRLERMPHADAGTFRISLSSDDDRQQALAVLRRAGIEVTELT